MIRTLPLLLALACQDDPKAPGVCQGWQGADEGYQPTVHVETDAGNQVTLQLNLASKARYGDGAPTAVFVQGGWTAQYLPIREDNALLRTDLGFNTVYMDLPGGDGTDGDNDRRGALSRAALGAALRYAAGALEDAQGCTLDDRAPGGRAEPVVLAGFSNGGNLAWATAADDTVDIPRLDGIATFETPIGSQFVVGEPGTRERPSSFFDAEACALTETNRVICDLVYGPLVFDPDENPETDGTLFVDDDRNGRFSESDTFLAPVWSPASEAWVHSETARIAADAQDVALVERADLDTTRRFWLVREAPFAMPVVAERFPDLAGISTGTPIDHVLSGLELPVHVTGMVAAMQAAGIAWTRLHPDGAYVSAIVDTERAWADVSANEPIDVVHPDAPMEPEDGEAVRGTDYLSAAVIEIMDRSRVSDWSADLDSPLVNYR